MFVVFPYVIFLGFVILIKKYPAFILHLTLLNLFLFS